jgi:hypothetical protein
MTAEQLAHLPGKPRSAEDDRSREDDGAAAGKTTVRSG